MAQAFSNGHYTRAQASRFIRSSMKVMGLSPLQMAQRLGVAPQTVNRWIGGTVTPRAKPLHKILALLDSEGFEAAFPVASSEVLQNSDVLQKNDERASNSTGSLAFQSLGLHFSDSIMALEVEAREVWVIKCGALREATRGFIGESVLHALKAGANFHYVFLPGSAAEETFLHQLKPWLDTETFTGHVTGYIIQDMVQATLLGLGQVPGAWIVIEYSKAQMRRLQRGFDVFKALPVREYSDSTRQHVKNEDGQPCWIELATPQASIWIERLRELQSVARSPQQETVGLIRILRDRDGQQSISVR
jgi:transcriptional regulator with XRE-family HTH domain